MLLVKRSVSEIISSFDIYSPIQEKLDHFHGLDRMQWCSETPSTTLMSAPASRSSFATSTELVKCRGVWRYMSVALTSAPLLINSFAKPGLYVLAKWSGVVCL
eukprot:TRINITY_DN12421_c1_g5_i2.p4 TRINITY_DN12421_c1_g5~~TRINITY_DN12421_c1_g5_i2.p4  ORF type:complete len:103 (-),score=4.42 TRINITY_DN12421_c1_g5_i2:901-1209(-)